MARLSVVSLWGGARDANEPLPLAVKPTFRSSYPLRWCGETCAQWSAPNDMRKLAEQHRRRPHDHVRRA